MPRWFTKSGKFNGTEKAMIRAYLTKEGITVNELIREAVIDVTTKDVDVKDKVDNCLPNKTKRVVMSGRVSEDHISNNRQLSTKIRHGYELAGKGCGVISLEIIGH